MTGFSWDDLGPISIFLPLLWAVFAVLTVLWIALPFAVFGVKRRLERIIDLLEAAGSPAAPTPGTPSEAAPTRTAERMFATVRRELIQTRTDISEESHIPGRARLFLDSGGRRIALAEVRLRGDIVEVEMDLGGLAAQAPVLRPQGVLTRLEGELAGQAGLRVLAGRERQRAVIQIGHEAETRIRDLVALLKSQILDVFPS